MSGLDRVKQYVLAHRAVFIIAIIIGAGIFLRLHNIRTYTTVWADDGGAHLMYVNTIEREHRLPTMQENYLAWHEPIYYVVQAGWKQLAPLFSVDPVNWMETLQIIIFIFLASIVALTAHERSKNIWMTSATVLGTTFVFVFVKLSAYVTNELFAQAMILACTYLFIRWRLAETEKYALVAVWSLVVGIAGLIKITALIVGVAAVVLWMWRAIREKKKVFLLNIIILAAIAGAVNAPWFWHKYQVFGTAFTINVYESETKQSLFSSSGWGYVWEVNTHIVRSYPYWFMLPHSVWTILFADTFSDYYNLFSHVHSIERLPESSITMINNGRYAPVSLLKIVLWTNRVSVFIAGIWFVGIVGWVVSAARKRRMDVYDAFLFLLIVGGISAILYNMLRHPYLGRGVVKIQFIAFILPLIMIMAYCWWGTVLKTRAQQCIVYLIPWIFYIIVAWPMLWVHPF